MPPDNPIRYDQPTLVGMVAQYLRDNARAYGVSALLLVGVAVLSAWIPRKIGHTIDSLVAGQLSQAHLITALASLLAAGILIYLMRVAWRIKLYGTAYQLGVQLRHRLFVTLTGHGPRFFQKRRTGDLMALATNDIDAVEMAAGEAFLAGFDGMLTLVIVVAVMSLGLDWRLTLIAMIPFPVMALSFWFISKRVHLASRQSLASFARLNEQTQETLAGVRSIRAIGLQTQTHQQFSDLAEQSATAGYEELKWEAAFDPAIGLSMTAAMALVLGAGGHFLLRGELTIGELTAFSMYMGQLIWPMFAMGWVLSLIERGRAAWERLGPVLRDEADIEDKGFVRQVPAGRLQFTKVSLNYPGQHQAALQDLTFSLTPGKTLGIVGPTGAGKSTLIALLMRHYQPNAGNISWAGHDLAELSLDTLRQAIAWVPQEPFLFSDSIAGNIALARPQASPAQIQAAAQLAELHSDIAAFPDDYNTIVGERGVTLSGGQRQRVAIARALLADAPLLILDDALSAVDTRTESKILAHLRQRRALQAEHSAIIVSHRLSAVIDADEIIVLHHGQLSARGSHKELVSQNGWYAEQWRYQQLEASLDEQ